MCIAIIMHEKLDGISKRYTVKKFSTSFFTSFFPSFCSLRDTQIGRGLFSTLTWDQRHGLLLDSFLATHEGSTNGHSSPRKITFSNVLQKKRKGFLKRRANPQPEWFSWLSVVLCTERWPVCVQSGHIPGCGFYPQS